MIRRLWLQSVRAEAPKDSWGRGRRRPGPRRRLESEGRVLAAFALLFFSATARAQDLVPDPSVSTWASSDASTSLPLGLDFDPAVYAGRANIDATTVALGRALFFDGRLSRSGRTHCGTCHQPERCFTDGRALAVGDDGAIGRRNAPTIVNRAFGRSQFWDGRAASLEEQALGPLLSPSEMGMTPVLFQERLAAAPELERAFRNTFGDEPSLELAARAIAAFEATIVTGDSPFDRYEWLGEMEALSEEARAGLLLFRGKARCSTCHVGPNLSDEAFHNLGVGLDARVFDRGREGVTGSETERGEYKTPTLRNVSATAPYMHDGSLASLEDVVRFYDEGGMPNPNRDPELRSLDLVDEEREQLVAFLESLTGEIVLLSPELFSAQPSPQNDVVQGMR